MKAVVAAFNQEKALVGAFSVIANIRMELLQALVHSHNYHNRRIILSMHTPEQSLQAEISLQGLEPSSDVEAKIWVKVVQVTRNVGQIGEEVPSVRQPYICNCKEHLKVNSICKMYNV